MSHAIELVLLAVAGGVGTLLRVGCGALAVKLCGESAWVTPGATLSVNVVGAFAFGSLFGLAQSRQLLTHSQQTVLLVGLLGGFTTYSSFAFQTVQMLDHGRIVAATLYVVATTTLALGAAWLGLRLCS